MSLRYRAWSGLLTVCYVCMYPKIWASAMLHSCLEIVLWLQASNYLYLVMEYCAGGDLAGYIRRCKRVPEVTACAAMRQLGAGLKELYTRHMVHVSAAYQLNAFAPRLWTHPVTNLVLTKCSLLTDASRLATALMLL